MPAEWSLNYPRYMIEDGCPDVSVGQILTWLVEFWPESTLALTQEKSISAIEVGDHRYLIAGEVVFLSHSACVIDFGLRAIGRKENLPLGVKDGDFVRGEVGVGLPLSTEAAPEEILASLDYEWEVQSVLADLTPRVEVVDEFGRHWFYRDDSRVSYRKVKSTEDFHAESYVLRCRSKSSI